MNPASALASCAIDAKDVTLCRAKKNGDVEPKLHSKYT
ncbi:uncharacterized protein METZ01_LOCUS257705 [marine metagenome]|uniref:Uncharacterized protein n=1 Tax=marine metagenome TaxID=408172 RepID=A0A382J1Z3_9ZZZZ